MQLRHSWLVTSASLAVALLVATAARAEGDLDKLKTSTPDERAKIQTALMSERLDLTADQKPKIAALNLETAQKMEPIIQGSEGPLVRMRQASQINEEKEAKLKQILSPAQLEKYLAGKEEMRQKFEQKLAEKLRSSGGS